jgi:arsenate reductase-like glutaredoxin family protein
MGRYSHLSEEELKRLIHKLEARGHTGRTNATLHALNCAQTDRLSDSELLARIRSRAAAGKPIGKLAAAARRRGLSF